MAFNLSVMAINSHGLQPIVNGDSDSLLISQLIKQLSIDSLRIKSELIRTKVLPEDPAKTIVSIPIIAHEEGGDNHSFVLDVYIVVAATKTGKILQKYYEQSFWESDAIALEDISIDTAPYRLHNHTRAFGIVSHYGANSMPNPFSQETLSLFIPTKKSIIKVLDKLVRKQYRGENDTRCTGRFENETSTITVSASQTNGYADLIVKRKIIYSETTPRGEDCDEKVVKRVNKKTILKFRNGAYALSR